MKKHRYARWVLLCLTMAFATFTATAAPPSADLSVEVLGPNDSFVYTPYVYSVRVSNIGNRRAQNVNLNVDLPLTATSPQVHVLGRISSIDSNCQLVNNRLECDLGRIRKGKQKTIEFTYVLPVTTRTLSFAANVTANSDSNPNNNSDTKVLNPKYQDNVILAPQAVTNFHCTGSPSLTSFYECEVTPTSVTNHPTTFNANGSISFAVPGYGGTWFQPTPKELKFSYEANNTTILEFHGYAISSTCFDGLSTFPTNPNYVSPYRVCFQ